MPINCPLVRNNPDRHFCFKVMSLRFFLLFLFILLMAAGFFYEPIKKLLFHPALNTQNLKHKNIILISIDTLRADHLGVYGYHRDTSPFIDQLARESIVFEQAFAASGFTLPSHTSLFTGLYPKTHKVTIHYKQRGSTQLPSNYKKTSLNEKYKTLAEYLSSRGYHTLWVGSKKNNQLSPADSEGRGFQTKLPEILRQPKFFKWLDNNPNKKFFAFLHTSYAHDPYYNKHSNLTNYPVFAASDYRGSIPETFDETFKKFNKKYKLNADITDLFTFYYDQFVKFWWSFVNFEDSKDIQRLKDLYDDCILHIDHYIGRLISILKARNIYENTIIIIVSDHGEAFGEHGQFRHMTLHKEILHVPMILHIPGFSSKRIKSQVSLIDVYPTILDLIGQDAPHQMDGKSLLPLMRGTRKKIHDYIFGSYSSGTSISDGKWKLIRTQEGNRELYYIVEDPYEKREVSEKYPNILEKLEKKIDAFLEQNPE